MSGWIVNVLIVVLTPIAAFAGSFCAALITSREQFHYQRRIEVAEAIPEMLHDIQKEFIYWLSPYSIMGEEKDEFTKGRIILSKLNRLRDYRNMRRIWLDNYVDQEVIDTLEATIEQLSNKHSEYFKALLQKDYLGSSRYEEIRENIQHWLSEELAEERENIVTGLTNSLSNRRLTRRSEKK